MIHTRLSTPRFMIFALFVLALTFIVACGSAADPTTAPATESAASITAVPTAAAGTVAAPAKVVASGKMTLAWHAGLSSTWLDPQDNPAFATPYNFAYALHDALVKTMPAGLNTPSLAERWEFSEKFDNITFFLRPGTRFHNGDPVTSDDVKFTFENYTGGQADTLQGATESIELIDQSTIRFNFDAPFLDFLLFYGTFSSGAGFIVPAKYYQEVGGSEEYIKDPIGAGPYKLIEELPGDSLEFEAFEDFYRPVHIKEFVMRSVQEATTRVALIEAGDVDIAYNIPGQLIERVQDDPDLLLVPTNTTAVFWLEMIGLDDPDNPLSDVRVRQAVSLALDRQAISDAETFGFSQPANYWIPPNISGAPPHVAPEEDLAKAKELMKEAGYPDGFDVGWLTPIPNYFSFGERLIGQLGRIGINPKLQTMERGAFFDLLEQGDTYQERVDAFGDGVNIPFVGTGSAGGFVGRFNAYVRCDGYASRTCVPEVDALLDRYEASVDVAERELLAVEIHDTFREGYYFIPTYWFTFINAVGPRIANREQWGPGKEIFANPQMGFYGPPWENWKLVE